MPKRPNLQLLNPGHVAEMHGCNDDTVRKAVRAGELHAYAVGWEQDPTRSTHVVIDRRDAQRWKPRRPGRPR